MAAGADGGGGAMCPPTAPSQQPETPKAIAMTRFNRGVLFGSLAVFTLVSGFASTFPFMHARRDELGCTATCIGFTTSLSSLLRLVGAMLVGRLSDSVGRRPMLWLGFLGCALSLAISAGTDSIEGLYLSLVPSSLLNHTGSVLKALFADYAADAGVDEATRASAMGKLGMALGVSLMVGPVLASAFATSYKEAVAVSATTTSFAAVFLALLPAPRTIVPSADAKPGGKGAAAAAGGGLAFLRRFFDPRTVQSGGARLILAIRFFAGMAFHVFQVVWPASLKSRFDFGPSDHGVFMAVVGFSYALSQGVIAKMLIKRFEARPAGLVMSCILLLGLGRPIALWTSDVRVVYCCFCAMVVALGVLNTLISSACARLASGDLLGGLFGMVDAVENCTGIIGPVVGGIVARHGEHMPISVVVACYMLNFLLVLAFYRKHVVLAPSAQTASDAAKKTN